MERQEAIRALAEIVAGLQVPVSMGAQLGAAREPWDQIKGEVKRVGWTNADEVEMRLNVLLAVK